jgi:hypothetical protein
VARAAPSGSRVPTPHTMSVQKNPDKRDLRYLRLVTGRLEGRSEDEIAASAGCDSPGELYRQLTRDRFPVCGVCGATHVEEGHCEQPEEGTRKRRARQGQGEANELPLAYGAAGLFRDALLVFEDDIASLKRRREYFKDKRFVVEYALSGERGESWIRYRREDMPEAEWREFCQEHSKDPSLDYFDILADYVAPGGVSQAPPEPLTRLIGMYILSGLPVEILLRALHPDAETVDMEQLRLHINGKKTKKGEVLGLKSRGKTVARLVRGGTLRPGPSTGELSEIEEEAAAYIQLQRRHGVPDEKILQELREGYGFSQRERAGVTYDVHAWPNVTMDDLRRLGKLELGLYSDGA